VYAAWSATNPKGRFDTTMSTVSITNGRFETDLVRARHQVVRVTLAPLGARP
jgi:hypothetical protein